MTATIVYAIARKDRIGETDLEYFCGFRALSATSRKETWLRPKSSLTRQFSPCLYYSGHEMLEQISQFKADLRNVAYDFQSVPITLPE